MLQADYHIPLRQAVFGYPLTAALALWPAIAARRGYEVHGPNYVEKAIIAARRRARDFLRTHFRIVPD